MIQFTKTENGFVAKFTDNELYLRQGTISLPANSLSLTVDRSDIATFKKAANGDVLFSGHIDEITFDGETADKATIAAKFAECCLAAPGGGIDPEIEERLSAVEYDVELMGAEVEENGQVTSEALTELRKMTLDNEEVTSEALTELRALLAGIDERLTAVEQGGGSSYDDTELRGEIESLGDRMTSAEEAMTQSDADIYQSIGQVYDALAEESTARQEADTELSDTIVQDISALDARVTTNETDINTLDTTMSQAVTQLAER